MALVTTDNKIKTSFMIASSSKLFTSRSVGITLSECGYPLGVNTRIKDVIPEYEPMDAEATQTVTFANVLSHRTGLPRYDHYTSNLVTTLGNLVRVRQKYSISRMLMLDS
jgi:CubicO group peptidase (beta-lactamase class C family)